MKLEKFLQFFVNNFIRFLSLYQEVLGTHQIELLQPQYLSMQSPLIFPPLMEATEN